LTLYDASDGLSDRPTERPTDRPVMNSYYY
jgi:hypothetical protein